MIRYRQNLLMIALLCFTLVLVIAFGCIPQAGKGQGIKLLSEMEPKEKATWMLSVYNSQAKDYKRMVQRPDLTNDQKAMLRNKKDIAKKLWPLINTYRTYVNSGAVPTREVEDQIVGLINDLTVLVLPYVSE